MDASTVHAPAAAPVLQLSGIHKQFAGIPVLRDVQLNLTGHFDTAGFAHTLLTGVEYENYDYNSIIQRSSAAYPIDIYNPISTGVTINGSTWHEPSEQAR